MDVMERLGQMYCEMRVYFKNGDTMAVFESVKRETIKVEDGFLKFDRLNHDHPEGKKAEWATVYIPMTDNVRYFEAERRDY